MGGRAGGEGRRRTARALVQNSTPCRCCGTFSRGSAHGEPFPAREIFGKGHGPCVSRRQSPPAASWRWSPVARHRGTKPAVRTILSSSLLSGWTSPLATAIMRRRLRRPQCHRPPSPCPPKVSWHLPALPLARWPICVAAWRAAMSPRWSCRPIRATSAMTARKSARSSTPRPSRFPPSPSMSIPGPMPMPAGS